MGSDTKKHIYDVYRFDISFFFPFVLFENSIKKKLMVYENWKPILYIKYGLIIHTIHSVSKISSMLFIFKLKHKFIEVIINNTTVLMIEGLFPVRKR